MDVAEAEAPGAAAEPPADAVETYYCYVCFDHRQILADDAYTLPCGHSFCTSCLFRYLSVRVVDGDVKPTCFFPVAAAAAEAEAAAAAAECGGCPHADATAPMDVTDDGDGEDKGRRRADSAESHSSGSTEDDGALCGAEISPDDIRRLLSTDAAVLAKYEYFVVMKGNPNARECSRCQHLQVGSPDAPAMTCERCQLAYCFFHDGAHPHQTCEAYELSKASETRQNRALLDSISKPCPGCQVYVEKSGGCNHIKCTNCGKAFCWLCGQEIEDSIFPSHFQWWNPSGCSNLQMNEAAEPSCCVVFCARFTAALQLVVLGPLVLVSTAVSVLLCCCLVPSMLNSEPPTYAHYDFDDPQGAAAGVTTQPPTTTTTPAAGSQQHQHQQRRRPLRARVVTLLSACFSGWGMFYMGLGLGVPVLLIGLGVGLGTVCLAFALLYPVYFVRRLCLGQYPWPDAVTEWGKRAASSCSLSCLSRAGTCACACDCPNFGQPRPVGHIRPTHHHLELADIEASADIAAAVPAAAAATEVEVDVDVEVGVPSLCKSDAIEVATTQPTSPKQRSYHHGHYPLAAEPIDAADVELQVEGCDSLAHGAGSEGDNVGTGLAPFTGKGSAEAQDSGGDLEAGRGNSGMLSAVNEAGSGGLIPGGTGGS